MITKKLFLIAALLTAPLTVSSQAFSQGRDPAAAEALFRDGRDAMKRRDYPTACSKFAESQRLDPAAGTVLNLAQCEEARGLLASAWQHYREASDQSQRSDPRHAFADKAAQALEPRVPKLTINLAADSPAGSKVVRDTVELGSASLGTPLPVDPGEHTITVSAAGHSARRFTVLAVEGKRVSITVRPGAAVDATTESSSPDEPARTSPPQQRRSTPTPPTELVSTTGGSQQTIGWLVAGVGLLGGGGAALYYGLDAKKKDGQAIDAGCHGTVCPNEEAGALSDRAGRSADYALISGIAGGAVLVGGLVLVLTAPSNGTDQSAAISLRTVAGAGQTGLELGGMW